MPLLVALLDLFAGLLLLAVGGTLAAGRVAPAPWIVAVFVAIDAGLLASGLLALPVALLFDAG